MVKTCQNLKYFLLDFEKNGCRIQT